MKNKRWININEVESSRGGRMERLLLTTNIITGDDRKGVGQSPLCADVEKEGRISVESVEG